MGERTHFPTDKSNSKMKHTWSMIIAGTAIMLLAAGVMLQMTRPTSAYPEDGRAGGGKSAASAKALAADSGMRITKVTDVARVGREHITYDELAKECIDRVGKEILNDLISRKILQQACDAQGLEISEAEVSKEIDKQAKNLGLATDQYLQMIEAERNIPAMKYRRDSVWPLLALRKLAGEDVTVTKEELKKAFISHFGPRVKARAIVLDNPRRARDVWELAQKDPDDFERLASKESMDPSSRAMGGVIPPIRRYGGSEELEKVAFKLKEGEISPVVQVGLKQHIILKCEGRTEPTVKDISEVEETLMQELREEKIQMAIAEVFKKLKAEARVDNYLTGEATRDRKSASAKGPGSSGSVRQTAGSTDGASEATPTSPGAAKSANTGKSGDRSAPAKPHKRSPVDE
jgi:foldase protein PrsA